MEKSLQRLLSISRENNRADRAMAWKKTGGKVVGLLCSYIPEEIIHAAGMLPWRIIGSHRTGTPKADGYRPKHTCRYCNHVLESMLNGEYDFLDAVVATSWDQDLIRLWDVCKYLGKIPAMHIIHLPLSDSAIHKNQYAKEVKKFFTFIQTLAGRTITAGSLFDSITLFNRFRAQLHHVYDLRKGPFPPLSGSEVLGLTTAALLMPKDEFAAELKVLMPYLEKRVNPLPVNSPRLLVSSDRLDNPDYMKLVEETGCLVAMDDLDTGSRYFWRPTETDNADSLETMLQALAYRYHDQPADPGMMTWAGQVRQVAQWVGDFNIQGVLELPLMYSRSRQMRAPYFKDNLSALGIPVASFERDYPLSGAGQLKTRVGAFIEMLP